MKPVRLLLKDIILMPVKYINYTLHSKNVISSLHKRTGTLTEEEIINYNKSRKYGYQPLICYAPKTSLYFRANGDVLVCCRNLKDVIGNIQHQKVSEIWESEKRKQLAEKIQQNNLEESCGFCKLQIKNKNYTSVLGQIYDQPFHSDNEFPVDITFEVSNKCNLECIMCNGNFSSAIRKNREQQLPLYTPYPNDFFEQLKPILLKIKTARFQGGEPFLINTYLEIMDFISLYNSSCKIYIQTNGTILNNSVKKILLNKNIHLSISCDAISEQTLTSIRKNINYKQFLENIDYFKKYSKSININFCLMNINKHEVISIINFCELNNFTLSIIPVEHPYHLSINNSKIEDIKTLINNLKQIKTSRYLNNIMTNTIHYLNNCIQIATERNLYEQNNSNQQIKKELLDYLTNQTSQSYVNMILPALNKLLNKKGLYEQKKLLTYLLFHSKSHDFSIQTEGRTENELSVIVDEHIKNLESINY